MGQRVSVDKGLLHKALGLAKLCSTKEDDLLSNVLVTIREKTLSLMSTSDYLASYINFPLKEDLPELVDMELSFLVSAVDFFNLVGDSEEDFFSFVYDPNRCSLTNSTSDSTLALSTKLSQDWVDISDRFSAISPAQILPRNLLQSIINFNKFFISKSQDTSMSLLEIRDGLSMSTDRSKIGILESPELKGLSLRIPGSFLSNVEKGLEYFPEGTLNISESNSYNLISSYVDGVSTWLGFAKCITSLPTTFDQIPALEEDDQVLVDLATFIKALSKLTTVASGADAKVKLTILDSNLKLTTLNPRGLESSISVPMTRKQGNTAASVTLPLQVLIKALKKYTEETCILKITNSRYVKICDEKSLYSVFPSMQS